MAFYVAVGPRGLLFRAGMILTGVMGSLSYWLASRRRTATLLTPGSWPAALPVAEAPSDLPAAPDDRALAGPVPAMHLDEAAGEEFGESVSDLSGLVLLDPLC